MVTTGAWQAHARATLSHVLRGTEQQEIRPIVTTQPPGLHRITDTVTVGAMLQCRVQVVPAHARVTRSRGRT